LYVNRVIVPASPAGVDRVIIIECPNCHSKYQYDEQRFEAKPSKKIKCARCQQIFDIYNPAFAAKPEPIAATGESTYTSRRATPQDATAQAPLPTDTTDERPIPLPPSQSPQLPPGKRLSLAILDGPDAGSVFRIEKPRMTIGRSNADLTLNDTEASRQHAQLEIHEMTFTLSDLGSTNGTLLDGTRIDGAVEIGDKAEFQVGSTTLMLIVTDDQ
jgi:predicted Zn finger-like uncharacterized protein